MSQPLRILQLVSTLTIGGAEQIVLNLAERVNPRLFATSVCSLSRKGQHSLQPAFERLGIPLLPLDSQRFYSLKTIQTVSERYVREQKIDLIHTHLTVCRHRGTTSGTEVETARTFDTAQRTPIITFVNGGTGTGWNDSRPVIGPHIWWPFRL